MQPHDNGSSLTLWDERACRAATVLELIQIANAFVASWYPEEISRLPADCRPQDIRFAEDLSSYSFKLVHRHCVDGSLGPEFARMTAFFAHASRRLSALLAQRASRHELEEELETLLRPEGL